MDIHLLTNVLMVCFALFSGYGGGSLWVKNVENFVFKMYFFSPKIEFVKRRPDYAPPHCSPTSRKKTLEWTEISGEPCAQSGVQITPLKQSQVREAAKKVLSVVDRPLRLSSFVVNFISGRNTSWGTFSADSLSINIVPLYYIHYIPDVFSWSIKCPRDLVHTFNLFFLSSTSNAKDFFK